MSQSFGVIKADGSKVNGGSGDWDVNKESGKGNYRISFRFTLPREPVVIVGAFGMSSSEAANNFFSVSSISTNDFRVISIAESGDPNDTRDADFSFIAVW